ncbi:MAG: CDC48 family AAA ATPase, partial [Nanoarchaeota archaeon]
QEVTYEDIAGLDDEGKKLMEMVELPLKHPELFNRLGVDPPKGVLLHGPPGTGKTLIAKAVANESDANFILVNGHELTSKFYGETEKRVREIFQEAEKNAPSIIFIDEIDSIAPKREETYGEVERRMVSQMLAMMDGLKSRGKVIVIGATNRPNALDPALRRPGRFDREISIGVPNKHGRLNILKIHTRNTPLAKDVSLERLAEVTHGFVGADISALAKEAAMSALRRILPGIDLKESKEFPKEVLDKLSITDRDFKDALKIVRPSALREVLIETPNVHWEDIGGLDSLKQELNEAVEWPLKHPQVFTAMGIRAPRGILLYGPPGTGKTQIAKAVANESEANFIYVKGPELISKWVGDSEKGIRKIFEKARQVSPCIIFFDEIDAIAHYRGLDDSSRVTERVVNQLLVEMDGLEELHDVVVIAATNRIDMIDPGLLRPGRFDKILSTKVPNELAREVIFRIHTRNMPLADDVDISDLAKRTANYAGADIEGICREAALIALRKNIKSRRVEMTNFEEALEKIKPSIREEDLKAYSEMEENYIRRARAAIQRIPNYLG